VAQYGSALSAKFQPLIQVLAMQHSTANISLLALDIGVINTIISTIAMTGTLLVLFVALIVTFLTRRTPKKPALIRMRPEIERVEKDD